MTTPQPLVNEGDEIKKMDRDSDNRESPPTTQPGALGSISTESICLDSDGLPFKPIAFPEAPTHNTRL